MNVDNIILRMNIEEYEFFKTYENVLKPFIDCYFRFSGSEKYELFHEYLFAPDISMTSILNFHSEIITKEPDEKYINASKTAKYLTGCLKSNIDFNKLKIAAMHYSTSIYVGKASYNGKSKDFFLGTNDDVINGYSFCVGENDYFFERGYVDFGCIDKDDSRKIYSSIMEKIQEISERTRSLLEEND